MTDKILPGDLAAEMVKGDTHEIVEGEVLPKDNIIPFPGTDTAKFNLLEEFEKRIDATRDQTGAKGYVMVMICDPVSAGDKPTYVRSGHYRDLDNFEMYSLLGQLEFLKQILMADMSEGGE